MKNVTLHNLFTATIVTIVKLVTSPLPLTFLLRTFFL